MQLQHFPFTIPSHLAVRLKLSLPILLLPFFVWWHSPLSAQTFVKITDAGNPIVSDAGAVPNSYTGCSWVDYDNDGKLDLFVNQKVLYRNLGGGNFARDNTAITNQGDSFGNTWADLDNDGDLDCFVAGGTPRGSFLYRNDGNRVFTKIRTGAIGDSLRNTGWTGAWADYNNDSFVDLIISAPNGFAGINHSNRLFHNNGNGTFTSLDTSVVAKGLAPYTIPTWSDYDNDGDMDLFIGSGPVSAKGLDYLYRNQLKETGNAFFTRLTTGMIATEARDGQVLNWIDYDNDGDLDVYITNLSGTNGASGLANDLYRHDRGTLTKMAGAQVGSIVTDADLSLGSVWQDFDNDGDLDCFVNNDGGLRNRYYQNNNNGSFTRLDNLAMVTTPGSYYGASAGDYDNDGDVDLYTIGPVQAKGLYRNDLSNGNRWINILCKGTVSNRAAIGAKVRVKATTNGAAIWQLREISSQNCFNGHNMLNAHFGFGNAATIDSLKIEWPSGKIDVLKNVTTNQFLTVTEGGSPTGVNENNPQTPQGFGLEQNYPNPFSARGTFGNPATKIRYHLPSRQFVTLKIYNIQGREILTLANNVQNAGAHEIRFEASQLATSGVYFIQITAGSFSQTRRMVLAR